MVSEIETHLRLGHHLVAGEWHKRCSTCKEWRLLRQFGQYSGKGKCKDGLQWRCRNCPARKCKKCRRHSGDFADRGGLDLYAGEEFGGHKSYCRDCLRTHQRKGGDGYDALLERQARNDELERGPAFDGTPRGKLNSFEEKLLLLAYGSRCLYKGEADAPCDYTGKMDCDHVKPKTWGGHNWAWNRQPMCPEHNRNTKRNYDEKDYRPDGGAAAREIFRLGIRDEKKTQIRQLYYQYIAFSIRYARRAGKPVAEVLAGAPTISEWAATNVKGYVVKEKPEIAHPVDDANAATSP